MTPIYIRLRELREEAGMTQQELADAAKTNQETISRIERGLTTRVDLPVLDRLCKALKCAPGDLLVHRKR